MHLRCGHRHLLPLHFTMFATCRGIVHRACGVRAITPSHSKTIAVRPRHVRLRPRHVRLTAALCAPACMCAEKACSALHSSACRFFSFVHAYARACMHACMHGDRGSEWSCPCSQFRGILLFSNITAACMHAQASGRGGSCSVFV